MFETPDDVLEHFGVKGMRWGVRNASSGGGSSSEKQSIRSRVGERNLRINKERQATLKARAAKGQVRISEINAEMAKLPKTAVGKRYLLSDEKAQTKIQVKRDIKKAAKEPGTGLTVTQKRVLIGAGVAGVIAGGAIAYKYGYDAEGIGASIRGGFNNLKYGDAFRKNADFAKDFSAEDLRSNVVAGVNPNYRTPGGQMNCRRATFAWEMRRRGYDVVATTSPMGYGQNESGLVNALVKGDRNLASTASMSRFAGGWGPQGVRTRAARGDTRSHGAETKSVNDIGLLRGMLSGFPNRSRGEAVFDMGIFAHSMQWENIDGVPHIFDSQKGSHFPLTPGGIRNLTDKWGVPNVIELTRLDNVDLDTAFLQRWVRNS